jgi:hypothetical protein
MKIRSDLQSLLKKRENYLQRLDAFLARFHL